MIAPGSREQSVLFQRISADDETEQMPPPAFGKGLSQAEIQLLGRWIDQGAPWEPHWAYVAPVRPALPGVADSAWPRNPIDVFVLQRLEKEGLTPAPEADRATLIRRLSFDLIGLPPTVAEVEAFLADRSPDAYEKVVDRLLASPHHGERMALQWLDLARYADTNGYRLDNHRDTWQYRDWVIRALNQNLPFDRFTVEQLAGDLLPQATVEQKIATGFHRNTMVNFGNGSDPKEYLAKAVTDRVATTATVWLGTTLACAQCHDHKYDPFTHKEFYQLYAFFNNVPEKGLDGERRSPIPTLLTPSPAQARRLSVIRRQLAAVEVRCRRKLVTVGRSLSKAGGEEEVEHSQAEWEQHEKAESESRLPKAAARPDQDRGGPPLAGATAGAARLLPSPRLRQDLPAIQGAQPGKRPAPEGRGRFARCGPVGDGDGGNAPAAPPRTFCCAAISSTRARSSSRECRPACRPCAGRCRPTASAWRNGWSIHPTR